MVLVDTSVWIDYFNSVNSWQTHYLYTLSGKRRLYVGDLILAEVLQGFRSDRDFKAVKAELLKLAVIDLGGQENCLASAHNYRQLRKSGITIRKTIDVLIATACIHHRLILLHNDRDFDHMIPLGLSVLSPA